MRAIEIPPLFNPSAVKPKRHYTEGGLPADLEARMFEKGLYSVGSPDSWKKRVNEKGEERLGSLDMSWEARAYRTLDVRKLSAAELKVLHSHELRRMIRFVIGPTEMKIVLKNQDIPDQFYLQPHQVKYVIEFNDKHRPPMTRKFLDLYIPPYFFYDHDFDGMRYHHAWDLCVCDEDLQLPEAKGSGTRVSAKV